MNVYLIAQRFTYPPLRISSDRITFTPISTSFSGHISWPTVFMNSIKVTITFILIFSVIRIQFLFGHWKEGNNLEQMCIQAIFVTLIIIGKPTFDTLENSAQEISFTLTQSLIVAKFRPVGNPSSKRIPSIKEMVVYMISSSLAIFPVVAFTTPLILDYHILKVVAKWTIQKAGIIFTWHIEILVDLLSCGIHGTCVGFGAGWFFNLLLIMIIVCEAIKTVSFQLFECMGGLPPRKLLQQSAFFDTKPSRNKMFGATAHMIVMVKQPSASFTRSWKLYQKIRILMQIGNTAVANFLHTLLTMGIVLASCSGYTLIKLYHKFPLALYLPTSMILPFSVGIIFTLAKLAAAPNRNGDLFAHFWNGRLENRLDKRRLLACPPIGYSFGFIKNVKLSTALNILNVIVNLVASAAMLKLNEIGTATTLKPVTPKLTYLPLTKKSNH